MATINKWHHTVAVGINISQFSAPNWMRTTTKDVFTKYNKPVECQEQRSRSLLHATDGTIQSLPRGGGVIGVPKPVFCPCDLDLWSWHSNSRDQTCLPCEFGANPSPRHLRHKQKKLIRDSAKNRTLLACGKNNATWYNSY